MDIILYLIQLIQYLYQQNCWLLNFICRYIPLKQWAFDDSHSPKYQKFKVDQLPKIVYHHQDWDWKDLNNYYTWKYGKPVKPVRRRSECNIPEDCSCPACKAPQPYLYRNNGKAGQLMCKVCGTLFSPDENRFSRTLSLKCPYYRDYFCSKKYRVIKIPNNDMTNAPIIIIICNRIKIPVFLVIPYLSIISLLFIFNSPSFMQSF